MSVLPDLVELLIVRTLSWFEDYSYVGMKIFETFCIFCRFFVKSTRTLGGILWERYSLKLRQKFVSEGNNHSYGCLFVEAIWKYRPTRSVLILCFNHNMWTNQYVVYCRIKMTVNSLTSNNTQSGIDVPVFYCPSLRQSSITLLISSLRIDCGRESSNRN